MKNAISQATKKTMIVALGVATIATAGLTGATQDANAGSRDFWTGAAVGAVTGAIVGSSHRRYRDRDVVYVERRPRTRTVIVERSYGNAHVNWCLNRYRSYDVRTDTYVPRRGVRKYCNSPYN